MFIYLFLLLLSLFSAPSLASDTFSFVEYNLAFALGISLPLIIIAFLIREKIVNSWWYTIILVMSLLYFLSSLSSAYLSTPIDIYNAAAILVTVVGLLPRTGAFSRDKKLGNVYISYYFSLAVLVVFLACNNQLFLNNTEIINNGVLWLTFAGLSLLTAFIRLMMVNHHYGRDIFRFNMLFIATSVFCVIVYLQINMQLSMYWLLLSAIFSYLLTLINYSWLLAVDIKKSVKIEVEQALSPKIDELETFSRDAVTHLPSQLRALKHFKQYFKQQAQQDVNKRYAVIVFKPINFNRVNQLLGQQNSDILLVQLAYCLQQQTDAHSRLINFDLDSQPIKIARLQSLQFLVILDVANHQYEEKHYVNELCQQLLASVPEAASFKSFSLNFELAFGIDYFDSHSSSINDVVSWAGDAMLEAEKTGQTIHYFNHQSSLITERHLVKMEQLKTDIAEQKLQWKVQPQLNIITQQVIGYELFVYWAYQDEEVVELKDFLNIAVHSGELFQLTKLMIKQACQFLSKQDDEDIKPVAINILSELLFEDTLTDYLIEQLEIYQLSSGLIRIEVPEQLILESTTKTQSFFALLKNLNIEIAIDEFSGNYQSLRFLRKLSINQLKVNCSELATDKDQQAEKMIMNALVNLAQVMHIPLVGTGINNIDAQRMFKEIGGVNGQGNTISLAVPITNQDK
jgi:predicted signal transduction protein with EAL and GGDEF domain